MEERDSSLTFSAITLGAHCYGSYRGVDSLRHSLDELITRVGEQTCN